VIPFWSGGAYVPKKAGIARAQSNGLEEAWNILWV
jgi:hypothetical protein